ncbi:hypothetical protein EYZ11_001591 [Aspergillus tanneri]|uniref:Uncharacterized protein n=1 Tax=Aspergillus tanneri TaxID=1220188 RepID=A0A4V3UQF6_9EURO|nr:hypothetical protein EYZ11_001591 [Aspergillus tanneri]
MPQQLSSKDASLFRQVTSVRMRMTANLFSLQIKRN